MAPPLVSRTKQTLTTLIPTLLILTTSFTASPVHGGSNWCVARSDSTNQTLQTALDFACASGADCTPIQSQGLCYLPNTIQAHASYAFNSYFQKKSMATSSCDFSGTATLARTDPSYGSCVYPSSLSTAGGAIPGTPHSNSTNPNTVEPPFNGGLVPGFNPDDAINTLPMIGPQVDEATLRLIATTDLVPVVSLFVVSLFIF